MAIDLISTPEYVESTSPEIISRWVATESPNIFRYYRRDWLVDLSVPNGIYLEIHTATPFTGVQGDAIACRNAYNDAMYIGTITTLAGDTLTTDIPWEAGMNMAYVNDNTLYGGYYFEGRLTINNVLEPMTVIASPDMKGYADIDVSGILRIHTALGKAGDYTSQIMKETSKSGKFTFEFRPCWYGSSEAYTAEGNTWYYGECVRSEEQGSNLHEFVATTIYDAPFLNMFTRPVYFKGLPFDISFILPEFAVVTPAVDLTVTMKIYNSVNTQMGASVVDTVPSDALEGYINSLNIDPSSIPAGADHMTVEIDIPE